MTSRIDEAGHPGSPSCSRLLLFQKGEVHHLLFQKAEVHHLLFQKAEVHHLSVRVVGLVDSDSKQFLL